MEKNNGKEKIITIMLDVEGTIDNIDDKKAEVFMHQLDQLKIKFGAEKVIIRLSSHLHTGKSLKPYLEVLHGHLLPNIVLGTAFYLFGTYNYETEKDDYKGFNYNINKTKRFEEDCLNTSDEIVCIGLIDDSLNFSFIINTQEKTPVFIIRPSQKNDENLNQGNIMCYTTQALGIEGVIEGLSAYLRRIKIEEKAKEDWASLHISELIKLCQDKNLALIYRNLFENKIDTNDYKWLAHEMSTLLEKCSLKRSELEIINSIIEIIKPYLEKEDLDYLKLINKDIKFC